MKEKIVKTIYCFGRYIINWIFYNLDRKCIRR